MSSNVLTPEEEEIIRNASIASSCEIDQLLAIIQRLVNLLVEPSGDRPVYYSTTVLESSSEELDLLFSDRAESEIRRIAKEEIRKTLTDY